MGTDEHGDGSPSPEPPVPLDVLPLHSTNLLTVLDDRGVVRYESPAIERIFGFDQAELRGEQVAEYFHPDDRDEVVEAFRTVVASEEHAVEAVEYRHETADGTHRWVESVASSTPTPEGFYVVNTRDVSERKARERELVATNERLDEFASVVSHDLRNPLQVARGQVELAKAEAEGASDRLERVERAHERMESLIENLLEPAADGTRAGGLEAVQLDEVVADAWENVETGDATLVADSDRRLRADRSRLRQLVANVVRNAVEHGNEAVTIEIGECSGGFYVEDDGPGIPEGVRHRVFERGYADTDGGTGIGLRIVERICEDHGWTVHLTDGEAGGARFEFTGVGCADEV